MSIKVFLNVFQTLRNFLPPVPDAHLFDQAVQALVVLGLTDCTGGKKGVQQGFLSAEQHKVLFRQGKRFPWIGFAAIFRFESEHLRDYASQVLLPHNTRPNIHGDGAFSTEKSLRTSEFLQSGFGKRPENSPVC